MRSFITFIILSVALLGLSQDFVPKRRPQPAAAGGVSYLLSQDFESGSAPAGWTITGTPNWQYTPLEGTYSAGFTNGQYAITTTFTTSSEVWIFWEFDDIVDTGDPFAMYVIATDGSTLISLDVGAAGVATVAGGTINIHPVTSMTKNVHYYCWLHFKTGSGANAVADFEFETSATKVGSGNNFCSASTGTQTLSCNQVRIGAFSGAAGDLFVFDKLRVNNVSIGSNPP